MHHLGHLIRALVADPVYLDHHRGLAVKHRGNCDFFESVNDRRDVA